jgi:exosortase/archaeosortase family protein
MEVDQTSNEKHQKTNRVEVSPRAFLVKFFLGLVAFQFAYYYLLDPDSNQAFERFRVLNASSASFLLKCFGFESLSQGVTLFCDGIPISVAKGCDGTQALSIFVMAVLAFPSGWLAKLTGIVLGSLSILAVNVFRVASLAWVGAKMPEHFVLVHANIWPVAIVFWALFAWSIWAWRIDRNRH